MRPQPPQPPYSHGASRRDFLSRAAALAGAAAVGGACATDGGGQVDTRPIPRSATPAPLGPNDPIKVGVIGCGGMGAGSDGILTEERGIAGHLAALCGYKAAGAENVEVVAVCDVNRKRREHCARKASEAQGGVKVDPYLDHTELLARGDLHGVLIASPEHWHAAQAEDAIAAGIDVYVEKPMTQELEEAMRLRQVVAANDRILQVGTQFMMLPKYQAARKLIAEGAIGVPTLLQTSYCRNSKNGEWNYYAIDEDLKPGPDLDWDRWLGRLGPREWDTKVYHRWRRYKDFSTGIIGDLLVHKMTPLVYALDGGWPTRVTAHGSHLIDHEMENFDQVTLTVTFEGGQEMVVAGSTCNEQGLEDMIRGYKATLYLGGNNCELRPERIWVDDVDPQTVECPGISDQDELRRDWLRCIRSRQPNQSPVDYGAKIMVIVDLAARSMWSGQAWSFDPETMSARALA
jgi:predicted dehydrogenase